MSKLLEQQTKITYIIFNSGIIMCTDRDFSVVYFMTMKNKDVIDLTVLKCTNISLLLHICKLKQYIPYIKSPISCNSFVDSF